MIGQRCKMIKNKKNIMYLMIILLIFMDQIIKYYIEAYKELLPQNIIQNFLNICYCENKGIAFSIGAGNVIFSIICNIVVLGILAKFIISQNDRIGMQDKFILSLVLAGGCSNLIDRILRGFVIDYIDINELCTFPIFNFADILICLGAIGFGISSLRYIKKKNEDKLNKCE